MKLIKIIGNQFPKLLERSEWQAFLIAVAVMFANRMLDLGLSEADIYAMFAGAGAYGLSRGLAKAKSG